MRVTLRISAGIGLFVGIVYLLLYSSVPDLLEGTNPDGSTSITWHSFAAMAVLFILCELISFGVFRLRIALTVLGGLAGSVIIWMWLAQSRFAFAWEHRDALGIGPITWRTDLVLLLLLTLGEGMALLLRWLMLRGATTESLSHSTPSNI